jgi:hypothetical protein
VDKSVVATKGGGGEKGKGKLTERVNKTVSVIPTKKTTLPKVESAGKNIKQGYLNKKTDGFFFKWSVIHCSFSNAISS